MVRKGQRKLDVSGTSRVSVLDLGLGAATGLGVPFAAEQVIGRIDSAPTWMSDNSKLVGAGLGVVAQIPVFYYRGMGPALIGGAMALAYGVGPMLAGWLSELGSGNGEAPQGALAPRTSVGRLQAARRRAMGRLQAAPRRAIGSARAATIGAPASFVANHQGSAY